MPLNKFGHLFSAPPEALFLVFFYEGVQTYLTSDCNATIISSEAAASPPHLSSHSQRLREGR